MAKKICLDAGHYAKYNQSPANRAYYEAEVMWNLHLLLKKELEAYGFKVTTTRGNAKDDLALYTRGAASAGCDLFLSLHSNAAGGDVNERVDYPVALVQLDGRGDALGNKIAACIADTMDTEQNGRIAKRKGSSGGEYYGVLRGAAAVGTVGMIIEHSFHTNTRATNWLLNSGNLAKLAAAEAKTIAEYYGMATKTQPTTNNSSNNSTNSSNNSTDNSTGVMHRVQIGAFSVKDNADAMLAKAKAAGFENAFIATSGGAATVTAQKKSVDEIAREVLAGKWGNGAERKQKLTAAGYDPAAVQKRVNELL